MTPDDYPRLAYLMLLLVAVGGYFIASARNNIRKTAQQGTVWVLIFLGVIAAVGLWGDIRDNVAPRAAVLQGGQRIELPLGPDGHYRLELGINGHPVEFVIDTGATDMVLSWADAMLVGLDPASLPFTGTATTANGAVRTARVRLDRVTLGDVVETSVPAAVTDGQLDGSLLGMRYLQRFARIEISGGKMVLER